MSAIINCNGYYDLHFESLIVVDGMNVIDFGTPSDTPVSLAVNIDSLEVYAATINYPGPVTVPNPCNGDPIVLDNVILNGLCVSGPIHYVIGVPVLKTSTNVNFDPTHIPPVTQLTYATIGGDVSLLDETIKMVDVVPSTLPKVVVNVIETHVVSIDELEHGYAYKVFGTFRITLTDLT